LPGRAGTRGRGRPMSDEGGLFDASREPPDEKPRRPTHADWFGEPAAPARAEFVRLKCSLAPLLNDLSLFAQGLDPLQREARLPLWRLHLETVPDQPSRPELVREAGLLQRNRPRWNGASHRRWMKTTPANWGRSR